MTNVSFESRYILTLQPKSGDIPLQVGLGGTGPRGLQGETGPAGASLISGVGFKIVGAELRYDFQSLTRG